ncbi:MAG: hypothetical protein ACOC9Z_03335 [Chloroflexota bacterium]
MRHEKRILVCVFILLVMIVSACGDGSTSPAEDETGAMLDLETLTAETEAGTLQAQRADNSFAGQIEEGRVIGVAFLEEVGAGAGQDLQDEILVLLYDRQELALMTGALDADGAATLESEELSDFDASVELVMAEDAVSGTATFPDEEPIPFTAEAATGDGVCGVYWAHGSGEDAEVRADWVVLDDGRQWGCVCTPPAFNNPCCHLR